MVRNRLSGLVTQCRLPGHRLPKEREHPQGVRGGGAAFGARPRVGGHQGARVAAVCKGHSSTALAGVSTGEDNGNRSDPLRESGIPSFYVESHNL